MNSPVPPIAKRCLAAACLLLLMLAAQAGPIAGSVSKATTARLGAAAQNARLQHELDWYFGGKPQRGWHLYAPLIRHLIGTSGDAGSDLFAESLSRWQRQAGLPAAGVLDRETWSKMIAVFQSRRLGRREVPAAENLFQAPAGEFYDHSRPAELRLVERRAYEAYKRMLEAAAADPALQPAGRDNRLAPAGEFLRIISAFRSPAYQTRLRERNPKSGRAGLAVNSPHFTGRALDLYVGGEPVSADDRNRALQINTPVYQWLVKNAGRFGFHPYFYEPWHWEFRGE